MTIEFSNHAKRQMQLRGIREEMVVTVIDYPDQILQQDKDTTIFTKLIADPDKQYL